MYFWMSLMHCYDSIQPFGFQPINVKLMEIKIVSVIHFAFEYILQLR
jgi:hypothetical protein